MNIKIENFKEAFVEDALFGMRHPLESYHKIDTEVANGEVIVGDNDNDLAYRLIDAGTEHRKFMRQIPVIMDVTAPLYFFKEFDTYKIGTTANSTSTMHTIMKKPFTMNMFAYDEDNELSRSTLEARVDELNELRHLYLAEKGNKVAQKQIWRVIIQQLPSSFLQTRKWSANYEVLYNILEQRENHQLVEWKELSDQIFELCSQPQFLTKKIKAGGMQ